MSVDVSKVYVVQKIDTQANAVRIPDCGHTDVMSGTEIVVYEDGAVDGHSENANEGSLVHAALHFHSHSMALFQPKIWGSWDKMPYDLEPAILAMQVRGDAHLNS